MPPRGPAPQGTLTVMPVPPKRLKELVEGTVDHHASTTHPGLQEITIRWRGAYGYLDAWAGEGDENDEKIPLCRIEYLGGDTWAFAIYDPASETYTDAALTTGQHTGTPTEAYDTAALVHLTDYQK
jgi:hypothetical protein